MPHVGHEILSRLELCVHAFASLVTITWDGVGGKLCYINLVFHHVNAEWVSYDVAYSFGLIGVSVLVIDKIVGNKQDVVAPWAVVGIVDIVDEFVHVAFGFLNWIAWDSTHANPEQIGCYISSGVVVEHSEEVVTHIAVILIVAGVRLIGKYCTIALGENLAVVVASSTKHEQVLEFVLVSVIEHLAHESNAHGIGGSARELVENILLVEHMHNHVVVDAMHISNALGLRQKGLASDDYHVGGWHAVYVLVFYRFKSSYRLKRLAGIESDELRVVGGIVRGESL